MHVLTLDESRELIRAMHHVADQTGREPVIFIQSAPVHRDEVIPYMIEKEKD